MSTTKKSELSLTLKRVRRGLRTEVNTGATPIGAVAGAQPAATLLTCSFDCVSGPAKCTQTVVTKGGSIGGFKVYKASGG